MPKTVHVYQALARRLIAYRNCYESVELGQNWQHWREMAMMHEQAIHNLCAAHLPSGSGLDAGVRFNMEESRPDKLILSADFHHMNEYGSYCGWTNHVVTVRPSLAFGFDLRIAGRNLNGIKDYLSDIFNSALSTMVSE